MLIVAKSEGKPEIYYTIQGEGYNTGMPAIFLRLSNCNLHCVWCDAYYTFNWSNTPWQQNFPKVKREDFQIQMSDDEILKLIQEFPCKNVVVTGGEPLLQQQRLVTLLSTLCSMGYWIEIETNTTIVPHQIHPFVDIYNCSPKLESSANLLRFREKEEAYRFFAATTKAWFKFVIQDEKDLSEVLCLVKKYQLKQVYLMPEGTTDEQLKQRAAWLVEACKQYGFQFSNRLQIHLYGMRPRT